MSATRRLFLVGLAVLAVFAVPQVALGSGDSTAKPFGANAVWVLPRAALTACLEADPAPAGCLERVMRQNGASRQALDVNRLLDGEGYMTAFRSMGKVNLAMVEFPLRANTNQAAFLVGGTPPLVSSELPGTAVDISAARV